MRTIIVRGCGSSWGDSSDGILQMYILTKWLYIWRLEAWVHKNDALLIFQCIYGHYLRTICMLVLEWDTSVSILKKERVCCSYSCFKPYLEYFFLESPWMILQLNTVPANLHYRRKSLISDAMHNIIYTAYELEIFSDVWCWKYIESISVIHRGQRQPRKLWKGIFCCWTKSRDASNRVDS